MTLPKDADTAIKRPEDSGDDEEIRGPKLGLVGWARWGWRQLTSMRTALFLLLLLAVAAVPGSIFPQRGVDAARVRQFLDDNPGTGRVVDALGGFDVYASPWFSAIYLLLFISLIGCVVPRTRVHLSALRAAPPRTPARLDRMPAYRVVEVPGGRAESTVGAAHTLLRRRRYRAQARKGSVGAERGYLRETGNLVFHVSLVGLLVAVATGGLYGYHGSVIVPVGQGFANALSEWDSRDLGVWVDAEDIPAFRFTLNSMHVAFETEVPTSSAQFAAPREFSADVSVADESGRERRDTIRVNHPLQEQGVSVALAGNGYAPVITVIDPSGQTVSSGPVVFRPEDGFYLSTGVVKVMDTKPQLGLDALFAPSADQDADGPISRFPDLLNPRLFFTAYQGDLGLDTGAPQSVYQLDLTNLEQVTGEGGRPTVYSVGVGESVKLPDGTTVRLDSVERFAAFQISHDPAKMWALAFSILSMLGLTASLFVPRRRVWVRAVDKGEVTVVEVAALARSEDPRLQDEVDLVLEKLTKGT